MCRNPHSWSGPAMYICTGFQVHLSDFTMMDGTKSGYWTCVHCNNGWKLHPCTRAGDPSGLQAYPVNSPSRHIVARQLLCYSVPNRYSPVWLSSLQLMQIINAFVRVNTQLSAFNYNKRQSHIFCLQIGKIDVYILWNRDLTLHLKVRFHRVLVSLCKKR